ncbi:hypothetical protein, partial [Endozoicomonas sp. YOMI1]|uniref:hypothetical protein n=1 Tax=Endozoicomonas sp. YOMI1 TaxID=2828739 RepID=UPI002148BA8B
MNPWCTYFKCIYQSLEENKHLEIKAQLNALSDVQIKSLLIDRTPGPFAEFQKPIPLLELASTSREAGNIFFRISFDRLSSEELRVALLESGDSNQTLLQHACCVMDEPLFKQLEQKLGMQTLLEMITRPVNDLDSPLAFACLYNKSTYLFDTVIHQDRELIEKLLKGSPDIDQSLLQFMCNDAAMRCRLLSDDEYHHRIKYLLNALSKQDRFEAVRFTGKSNESALLWACTKSFDDFDDLATILTESLDDPQIAELCTAEAETGNSLVQKCLELDRTNKVAKLCMSIRDPLLRLKVLSICTSEGHSFFQQWLLKPFNNPIKYTEYLLQDMDDSHRDLLIAGDRSIWDQINTSTNHTLRQQEQTPIVNVMNRKEMRLANVLWEQIADPELQIKLLLYKTRHQTTLL